MLALLGIALFLVAVGGLSWFAFQRASAADALAARQRAEMDRKRAEWHNKIEARRARLRDAERRGIAS